MQPKRNIATLIAGFALLWSTARVAVANGFPQEPSEQYLVTEDVNIITGFYIREYSLAGNGIVDYRTARQILISEYNEYWDTVVETKEFPLFYWYDPDQDGKFEMWVDRKVEGCLCDIVPYHALGRD